MYEYEQEWKHRIYAALSDMKIAIAYEMITLEHPKELAYGDLAFPVFFLAKIMQQSPHTISMQLTQKIQELFVADEYGSVSAQSGYVNIHLSRVHVAQHIVQAIITNPHYGNTNYLQNEKIMIEFSSPNTNKPLHLGHLKNNILGESLARILQANGAHVMKVSIINDRGIHICKSMLAYQMFGNGTTPESEQIKSDHFVGMYYVRYAQWEKEYPEEAKHAVQELLQKWESGDAETIALWSLMNEWTLSGMHETYKRTGISFDKLYYESDTYKLGKQEVQAGLDSGVFYTEDDGSIWIDMQDVKLDKKIVQRGDGTSLYITQDIGTAINRYNDFPFNRLIYVVADEQNYHFKVLFYILQRLELPWADKLQHLAYGMVNLPHGKMKSREGTVVDADTLLDELTELASETMNTDNEDSTNTAYDIALGALHFYLLNSLKDSVFDPKKSLSFQGRTGPYLQYVCARITSIIEKYAAVYTDEIFDAYSVDYTNLVSDTSWDIIYALMEYPSILNAAADNVNPCVVQDFLYRFAKLFSRFYHEEHIIHESIQEKRQVRIILLHSIQHVFKHGMHLLNIPYIERM